MRALGPDCTATVLGAHIFRFRTSILLFVFVLCLSPARSQTSATGALTGIITDTSGAVLSGVQINVVNEATGEKRIVSSRPDGSYFVPQLLPGSYRVETPRSGFATLTRVGLRIDITETARLDLALRVGNVTEEVIVTASPLLVQTESSALGRVVNETVVTSLPLVARNYTQIVTLSPGISQSHLGQPSNRPVGREVEFLTAKLPRHKTAGRIKEWSVWQECGSRKKSVPFWFQ